MSTLFELAERCEVAAAPDRELDEAISQVCGVIIPYRALSTRLADQPEWLGDRHSTRGKYLPFFTASLDAAMTLAPEGLELAIYTNWPLCEQYETRSKDGSWPITDATTRGCWVRTYSGSESGATKNIRGLGHSPALAVCAISLRALAASADTHPQDGDVQQAPLVSGAVGAAETPKGQTDTVKGTDQI